MPDREDDPAAAEASGQRIALVAGASGMVGSLSLIHI